jgi:hypothetical protein
MFWFRCKGWIVTVLQEPVAARHESRRIARFRRAEDGATAIEFALVAMPFLFLLGVILEIGIMMFTEYSIQNAVEQAGRIMRVAGPGTMSGEEFRAMICERGALVKDCETRLGLAVKGAGNFQGLEVPGILSIAPGSVQSFTPGAPGNAVVIVATHDWEFIFPFMSPFANVEGINARRLHGIAAFRTELLE